MAKKYKVLCKVSAQEIEKDILRHELTLMLAISIDLIPTMPLEDRVWATEQMYHDPFSAREYWYNVDLLDALKQRKPSITIKRRHFTTQDRLTTQYEDHMFYWDEFWKEVK